MYNKKRIMLAMLFTNIASADADDNTNDNLNIALDDIQVVATKSRNDKNSPPELPGNESGNFIPPITSSAPGDTTHTTTQELNNMAGISILGSSQSISQNISIGGLNQSNIVVGVDGVNNYFTNFGGNSTRLLPSPYLFKEVTATQTGSDITYGSGNIGGAVNFTTLDPEDLLRGDKLATLATLGGNSATSGANTNLAFAARSGIVSYLVDVVATNDNDMALSNGSTLAYSSNQNLQVLGKIGVDISKTQSLKLSLLSMQNTGQYPARITNSLVGPDNPPANFDFVQNQATVDYRYNPDNPYFDVQVKASYLINKYNLTTIDNDLGWYRDPERVSMNTGTLLVQNTTKVAWQKLLYGIEYTDIQSSDGYQSTQTLNFPTARQGIYGIFLQDSWDITKKINITAGSRYNGYNSQSGTYNNAGSVFTNQIGLNYHFLPDWLAYIGYSEGFQAPTITNLYYSGYHSYSSTSGYIYQANPGLLPEVAHNKTAGFKYDTKFAYDQHFVLSANAFLNNVSNYVVWTYAGTTGNTNITQMSNIPEATLYGYDLSLKYTTPWFGLDTNFTNTYGSTQSGYISGKNKYVPAGAPLPIPQAKGFVGLTFPIAPIDSLIQVNLNYALEQASTPETIVYGNFTSVPAYTLYGLSYTWKPKGNLRGLQAMVGVDNIFNTNYETYNGSSMFPGEARNIYVQASYKY